MTTDLSKDYIALNAMLNMYDDNGKLQLNKDREAARVYFLEHVNANTRYFHDLEEKIKYLTENDFWDKEVFDKYTPNFVKRIFKTAYDKKFRFPTFFGAYKFYTSYALKSDDGNTYLERFEDRLTMVALSLADGDERYALSLLEEMIEGRYQPATPTFQNSGKSRRGELVSCFLLAAGDSLDAISYTWNACAQLSKMGGGVAVNLSNLREQGAPLKGKSGLAKGIVSWMKIYEDIFSTVDQLGTRQGAGAMYLSAHHPDILEFLDTKRENADEKVRIKTLSLGVVLTDKVFELARSGDHMYLFSPHDVMKVYGKGLADISVTEKYDEMVADGRIAKKKISPTKLLTTLAELQMESGYPYIMFEDTVNKANPVNGRVNMSNLCSEILQVNNPSTFDEDTGQIKQVGQDISCNLGSMNVYNIMKSPDIGKSVETAMRALTSVVDQTNIKRVPTIKKANDDMHSVGLGQMSLATYFGANQMYYGDEASIDFTHIYFMMINYYSLLASWKIAKERGKTFKGFEKSAYADGSYFEPYLDEEYLTPKTKKVKDLFKKAGQSIPTADDWARLKRKVARDGVYHSYRQAIPPTGSISYINNASASIHPITSLIEIRKEGKVGRVYYPTPHLSEDNQKYFEDAYQVGWKKLIDVYAAATPHVDQGLSCTLFFMDTATTRDINKAQIYAWRKGIKTLYYIRLRAQLLSGTDMEGCVSCAL